VNRLVPEWVRARRIFRTLGQCMMGCAGLVVLTFYGIAFGIHAQIMGFVYLLVVVTVGVLCGFWPASLTSLVAVACLDYYFTPPIFTFNITDPQDWVALGAFEATALIISRLSTKELRNAKEAALHREEMKKLYELSRCSLLLDLRNAPGSQLVVLIHRIFGASAVAIFDRNLGRQDRMGDWEVSEENLAKECYLRDAAPPDSPMQASQRVLRTGVESIGALVIRGSLSPLVIDGLASLTAIAMDRHQSFENEDRAEKARQGEQLRTTVLDALAHEFKTPLTAIQTASGGLLELGGLGTSQSDLASLIEREAVRLNDLCTRLLRTAKLETREVGLQFGNVNVQELILEVLAARTVEEEESRVKVAMIDTALAIRGDRALLAMILTQYIDNAKKYSGPGTEIEIAAQENRTEVLISVHNIGSTIRIEDRERIFDRFYRAPDSKDTVAGTGIGLSVVKNAAEAHHGHVWVISDEKEGTTFFLSVPNGARKEH
jgi:two-component system sensor histidine kinase KdpD